MDASVADELNDKHGLNNKTMDPENIKICDEISNERSNDLRVDSTGEEDLKVEESDTNQIPTVDDPSRFPDGGKEAYIILLGTFFGFTGVLAFVNSMGVFENYISAHILPNTPTSSIGWIFSVYSFFSFGGTLIAGPVFDKIGCKFLLVFGTVLTMVGFMCMSLSTQVWHFILSFSICAGIGSACTFASFLGVVTHYFLRTRGRAIGLSYTGGAISGLLFPIMFRSLFPKLGFAWSIRIGAFICLALLVVGTLMVKDRHLEFQQDQLDLQDPVIKQILSSFDFRIFHNKVYSCLVLALLGNGFAFMVSATYLPSYATTFGHSEADSYLLLTVFNSLSIPGRLIPAWLADKYGRFNSLCFISLLSTLAFFIIWVNRPVGHTLGGLFAFAAVFGFSSGSVLSLTPVVIGQICKVEHIGTYTGTAFFALAFGDLVGIPIGGAITNAKTRDSFDWLVIFVALCSVCGTIGSFTARFLYAGANLKRV